MKENHIMSLLEERPLASVSRSDLEIIKSHTAHCAKCLSAYEAARAFSTLIQERASVAVEPPPFFESRVMHAIRERNQASESFGFLKMWQAARTLVTSLAVLVALLTATTFYAGSGENLTPSSTDIVIDGPDPLAEEDITYSQVLTDVYDFDAEGIYEK